MTVLATDLIQQVKSRLAQSTDMSLAAVPTGVGGPPTLQNDDVILFYLNRAQEWLATNVYPIMGNAGNTALPAGTSSRFVFLNSLTPEIAGYPVWCAETVYFNGNKVQFAGRAQLGLQKTGWQIAAPATPVDWIDAGTPARIALNPPPASVGVLQVAGYCLPPKLVTGTPAAGQVNSVSFLRDDEVWATLPVLAALGIAQIARNVEDVYSRLDDLLPLAQDTCTRLYNNIDGPLRAWRFKNAPVLGAGIALDK